MEMVDPRRPPAKSFARWGFRVTGGLRLQKSPKERLGRRDCLEWTATADNEWKRTQACEIGRAHV